MSARNPKLDHAALQRVLHGKYPAALSREGRVALLIEVAEALLEKREPDPEAALFVGNAIKRWLQDGGDLAKDFFCVVKAHSHHTPSYIYREYFSKTCPHPDERLDGGNSEK